jgi:hypothetical protein
MGPNREIGCYDDSVCALDGPDRTSNGIWCLVAPPRGARIGVGDHGRQRALYRLKSSPVSHPCRDHRVVKVRREFFREHKDH